MELSFGGGERRTAHQMVRDTLRRAILDGSIPARTRLVQAEIAAQLQVSTTPVREALRDLATEGLIQLDAHRGAVVHEASLAELREIYDMRRLLEPEAVRRAVANLTEDQLGDLAELQEAMDAEIDPVRWVELNRTFHRLIASAAHSKRLVETLHRLEDSAMMYVGVTLRAAGERLREGNAQHHALLDACRLRDGEKAAEVMVEHLAHTLAIVEDVHAQKPGPEAEHQKLHDA